MNDKTKTMISDLMEYRLSELEERKDMLKKHDKESSDKRHDIKLDIEYHQGFHDGIRETLKILEGQENE